MKQKETLNLNNKFRKPIKRRIISQSDRAQLNKNFFRLFFFFGNRFSNKIDVCIFQRQQNRNKKKHIRISHSHRCRPKKTHQQKAPDRERRRDEERTKKTKQNKKLTISVILFIR